MSVLECFPYHVLGTELHANYLSMSHFLTVEWDVVLISYGCYENEMNERYKTTVHVSKSK